MFLLWGGISKMKKYLGVKMIEAEPLNLGDYNKLKGWEIPANEDPKTEGYKVVYPDGYVSWSPKPIFEEVYRQTQNLTFGLAIEALKKGEKVARSGWNGKSMFVYLVKGNEVRRENLRNEADKHISKEFGLVKLCPHIDMKAADGSIVVGWLASQTDMLSDDWEIIK